MNKYFATVFFSVLVPVSSLAFAEQADSLEIDLFCRHAEKVLLEKFNLDLNQSNCRVQNIRVEIGQFFHFMMGVVVAESNSNQQIQALTCSMTYGGLPQDNDIYEAMVCLE